MGEEYLKRFRKYYVIISLYGLHIPGLDRPKYPFFMILACLSICSNVAFCCDLIYLFKTNEEILPAFSLFVAGSYFWNSVKLIYFLGQRKKVTEIFDMWSQQLQSDLEPEKREEELNEAGKKSLRQLYVASMITVFPFGASALWRLIFTGTLALHTSLNEDPVSLEAPRYIVAYEATSVYFSAGVTVAYPAFVLHLMYLIEAELNFLRHSLGKIFAKLKINEHGSIVKRTSEETSFPNIICESRYRLTKWIQFHCRVIQFQKKLGLFIAPPVFCEFIFLVTNICAITYLSISGFLDTSMMLQCLLFIATYIYNIYRLCRAGDRIFEKSSRLAEAAWEADWMAYSQDLKNAICMISAVTQKGLIFNSAGVLQLASTTFRKMMLLQYQVFRFLKDIR